MYIFHRGRFSLRPGDIFRVSFNCISQGCFASNLSNSFSEQRDFSTAISSQQCDLFKEIDWSDAEHELLFQFPQHEHRIAFCELPRYDLLCVYCISSYLQIDFSSFSVPTLTCKDV